MQRRDSLCHSIGLIIRGKPLLLDAPLKDPDSVYPDNDFVPWGIFSLSITLSETDHLLSLLENLNLWHVRAISELSLCYYLRILKCIQRYSMLCSALHSSSPSYSVQNRQI